MFIKSRTLLRSLPGKRLNFGRNSARRACLQFRVLWKPKVLRLLATVKVAPDATHPSAPDALRQVRFMRGFTIELGLTFPYKEGMNDF